MRLFGSGDSRGSAKEPSRFQRISSGWAYLLKSLRESDGQRILDIGPTSSTNINFLTGLGHSIYMANLVADAADPRWAVSDPDAPFPAQEFVQENLDFGGRDFDTVLFWDTADYLPPELREAVVTRLYEVMTPGAQLLAFFHIKPEETLQRYHLRDDGQIDVQDVMPLRTQAVLNNRQIEQLFHSYATYKFFLAKDNLREVVVTR